MGLVAILDKNRGVNKMAFIHKPYLWIFIDLSTGGCMNVLSLMEFPIIQGPMAGGSCTPALVAGVSNAGGLGSLPGSLLAPAAIRDQVGQIRALTDRPFLLNFFVQRDAVARPRPKSAPASNCCVRSGKAWAGPNCRSRHNGARTSPPSSTRCSHSSPPPPVSLSTSSPHRRSNGCIRPGSP